MPKFIKVQAVRSPEHIGTPSKFREILINIDQIVAVDWYIESVYHVETNELRFYVSLSEDEFSALFVPLAQPSSWFKRIKKWFI